MYYLYIFIILNVIKCPGPFFFKIFRLWYHMVGIIIVWICLTPKVPASHLCWCLTDLEGLCQDPLGIWMRCLAFITGWDLRPFWLHNDSFSLSARSFSGRPSCVLLSAHSKCENMSNLFLRWYYMANMDTLLYEMLPQQLEAGWYEARGRGCVLQAWQHFKVFYSPDLEKKRMRCHHPEQWASGLHIPRKPSSHITLLARRAAAHRRGSTSTQTINATAPLCSPLCVTWMKLPGKWMSEVKLSVVTSIVLHLKRLVTVYRYVQLIN